MSPTAANKFRSINDFPELVDYLGDELDWPIETDDFEEMTFEYSAAELGLDEKTAPKFLEIRRLRPLDNDQPWGIFFIRFDDNKLPVVALRRLLSKLVLNKRSSSNSGDRASWHENDLLLISQTGNLGTKSISFAHFAANPEKTDLPILKLLGWDDDDTGLKIDYVIETLREKLIWPDDPTDSDAWRTQWREAFTLKNREVIQSSKEMAERLGQLALAIRTRLREVLEIESEEGPIHKLMSVFKENLISDLDTNSFSDMYAQTIAYGLLSARIINPKANTADAAHTQIPITNPFLKDLMETFLSVGGRSKGSGVALDFDELGINEVVDLLDNTNMEAVLRDFGDRNQKEDPVMHFFEGFLQEYDSQIRKERGVFYTPQPVVSFIVRSVDEKLRTEFGLEDGLADTTTWGELVERTKDLEIPKGTSSDQAFVQILDPATGTGTFPVEVIDLIYKTMTAKWQSQGNREAKIKELWNEYVPKFLLPRLHGYELMMAPYAIAHMKIGLKLYETGYRFESDERARVYLTNALEPAKDDAGTFAFAIPALAQEAVSANTIKSDQIFTVVIGNPPYSKSVTENHFTSSMISKFKFGLKEKKSDLNREEWKFMGLAADLIGQSKIGVNAFVINNAFLKAVTHRTFREYLADSFQSIFVLNLHGSSKPNEEVPTEVQEKCKIDSKDENIFAIQQGICVFLGVMSCNQKSSTILHDDCWGTAKRKLNNLEVAQLSGVPVAALQPNYFFVPWDSDGEEEYKKFIPITELFKERVSGVQSGRDAFVSSVSDLIIEKRLEKACEQSSSWEEISPEIQLPTWKGFSLTDFRKAVSDGVQIKKRWLASPFDERSIIFHKSTIKRMRGDVMASMLKHNVGLVLVRQAVTPTWQHVFVAKTIISDTALSANSREYNSIFPLRLFAQEELQLGLDYASINNLDWYPHLEKNPDKRFQIFGKSVSQSFRSFCYIYAVLFSQNYRNRYFEFLKIDWPRIPTNCSEELFFELSDLGKCLISAHLNESSIEISDAPKYFGTERNVSSVTWTEENYGTVWIDCDKRSAGSSGFFPVPKEVWEFEIGPNKPLQKWLKDRSTSKLKATTKKYTLTDDDLLHYSKMVSAITETIKIMNDIEQAIDNHGGWPHAFITATDKF